MSIVQKTGSDQTALPTPETSNAVAPSPPAIPWTVWLAPLASAGLLYLSAFPVACGWLAWVALVPWLCLVRAPGRPRRLYFAAWIGGLAFFWPVLQWMRVADERMYITWATLATYCAVYFPLALYLVRLLDRRTRLPLVLTFPHGVGGARILPVWHFRRLLLDRARQPPARLSRRL